MNDDELMSRIEEWREQQGLTIPMLCHMISTETLEIDPEIYRASLELHRSTGYSAMDAAWAAIRAEFVEEIKVAAQDYGIAGLF